MGQTHRNGPPVSLQEVAEWREEADGARLQELSLGSTQSLLTLPHLDQRTSFRASP